MCMCVYASLCVIGFKLYIVFSEKLKLCTCRFNCIQIDKHGQGGFSTSEAMTTE